MAGSSGEAKMSTVGIRMAASSVVCSWLVAACMSVACEKDSSISMMSTTSSNSSGLSKWAARRRKRTLAKCAPHLSGIPNLVSSCLAFQPCDHYQKSSHVSEFFFGFGSRNAPVHGRRRKSHRPAAHSGEAMAIAVQPSIDMPKKKPPTKQRRVVVTGMGVETPLGHDPDVFYNNLLEGVSGISEIEAFDCSQYPTNRFLIEEFPLQKIAGEIKSFSTDGWVAPKLSKRMDRFMLYMLTAGKKALADGGVTEDVMDELNKTRCGVLIGSAMGGMKGWMGPNYSISTACATSNFCILNAANHIIRGEACQIINHGAGLGGFVACRALSQRNNDPTKASRPWDSGRDGFVMGEGAGVLLLEELEHAKKALAQSGVSKEDVNYINAHATSTPAGDLKEYQALIHCFGQNPELKINSTKSMIGHLLGAAGAVEAVATVQAIRTGWVHPNINLENPDDIVVWFLASSLP
ncbi:hypothetical protein DH2020_018507 [Rehmannia glutinosa]|uniref:beta-ketoacyl-[acyl-carrier-protein] synthase I n=1 Tax=Rehmannia glutinosa TaxID=99300 RepID=A0ABR0WND4_REHGL